MLPDCTNPLLRESPPPARILVLATDVLFLAVLSLSLPPSCLPLSLFHCLRPLPADGGVLVARGPDPRRLLPVCRPLDPARLENHLAMGVVTLRDYRRLAHVHHIPQVPRHPPTIPFLARCGTVSDNARLARSFCGTCANRCCGCCLKMSSPLVILICLMECGTDAALLPTAIVTPIARGCRSHSPSLPPSLLWVDRSARAGHHVRMAASGKVS